MPSVPSLVRGSLAHHLGRNLASIHPWQHLERDLDVTPLELVLVALEVEDHANVELPMDGLDHAETVGELFDVLTRAVDRRLARGA